MDEHLLNTLYGYSSNEQATSIQDAQAELVEAVANESGIDLDTLSDDELDKFASYVLSEDNDVDNIDPSLAEADYMGRVMAHAYVDEQEKIASAHEGDNMIDYALEKQAELWELQKIAADKADDGKRYFGQKTYDMANKAKGYAKRYSGYSDIRAGRGIGKDLSKANFTASQIAAQREAFDALNSEGQKALMKNRALRVGTASGAELEALRRQRTRRYMVGGAKATGVAAGLGALGYGGYRMMKNSSYDPNVAWIEDLDGYEFAKLAELRAAEILLANGIDPETFEDVYPEHVKLASFPEPEDATDWDAAAEIDEYNDVLDDAALDILADIGF
jgi:hypothetical protein